MTIDRRITIRIDDEIQEYLDKYPYGARSDILRARIKNSIKPQDVPTQLREALSDYDTHLITTNELKEMYYAAKRFVEDSNIIRIINGLKPEQTLDN